MARWSGSRKKEKDPRLLYASKHQKTPPGSVAEWDGFWGRCAVFIHHPKIRINENNRLKKKQQHEQHLLTTLASRQDVSVYATWCPFTFYHSTITGEGDWIRGDIKEFISPPGAQSLLLHTARQQLLSQQKIQNWRNNRYCE